jgi:uncharacterized protein (DUF1919 family)
VDKNECDRRGPALENRCIDINSLTIKVSVKREVHSGDAQSLELVSISNVTICETKPMHDRGVAKIPRRIWHNHREECA